MKKDIETLEDIQNLVNQFYEVVRQDELIGPIFNSIIEDRWPQHLEKMYRFWQTILLDERTYQGTPFAPHAVMPLEARHFERWLTLFYQTVTNLYESIKANEALWRADKMAEMFQIKLEHYRKIKGNAII